MRDVAVHLLEESARGGAAVRYVLDLEHTHSIVLGSTTLERYREAIAAASMPQLDSRIRAKIDEHVASLRSRPPPRAPREP